MRNGFILALGFCALLGTAACGPTEYPLQPGDYVVNEFISGNLPELVNSRLNLNPGLTTATWTLPDDSVLIFHLTPKKKQDWTPCGFGLPSQPLAETMTVSPSPLSVKGITLQQPVLVALCSAVPELLLTGDRNSPDLRQVFFSRQ